MAFEYVNRRGERYYLLQGKTKTGKPKYYAARKPDGVLLDAVPEGYEIYEQPERGVVSVRKALPTRILPAERESLVRWTRELAGIEHFVVDQHGDNLVIWTPNTDSGGASELLDKIFGGFQASRAAHQELMIQTASYSAMMRFTLTDEVKRLFSIDRWCFRGGIDDWFPLAYRKPLEDLARVYLPHLNRESFFDLM